MSYPLAPTPPRPRPGIVTVAGYLLYLVAALLVISMIVSLATVSKALSYVRATYASDTNEHDLVTATKVGIGFSVVLDVVLIVLVVLLGLFNLRGRNGMRITTWVIAGLGVLCLGCGAFGNVTGSALPKSDGSSQNTTVNIRDVVPGWAKATGITIDVISVLSLIAVIILLALPASNAFFRKTPLAMTGYPGGYGPVPGYPQAPGFGPNPGYPQTQGYPQGAPGSPVGDPAYPAYPGAPGQPTHAPIPTQPHDPTQPQDQRQDPTNPPAGPFTPPS
jgi:hypothetical protein